MPKNTPEPTSQVEPAKPSPPPPSLYAEIQSAAAKAQKQGDHHDYAILNAVEVDLGKLRLHLAAAPMAKSPQVAAIVDKLKSLIF